MRPSRELEAALRVAFAQEGLEWQEDGEGRPETAREEVARRSRATARASAQGVEKGEVGGLSAMVQHPIRERVRPRHPVSYLIEGKSTGPAAVDFGLDADVAEELHPLTLGERLGLTGGEGEEGAALRGARAALRAAGAELFQAPPGPFATLAEREMHDQMLSFRGPARAEGGGAAEAEEGIALDFRARGRRDVSTGAMDELPWFRAWASAHGHAAEMESFARSVQRLRQWFEALDVRGSGHVRWEELMEPLVSMGVSRSAEQVQSLVERASAAGRSYLTFPEFARLLTEQASAASAAAGGGVGAAGERSKAAKEDRWSQLLGPPETESSQRKSGRAAARKEEGEGDAGARRASPRSEVKRAAVTREELQRLDRWLSALEKPRPAQKKAVPAETGVRRRGIGSDKEALEEEAKEKERAVRTAIREAREYVQARARAFDARFAPQSPAQAPRATADKDSSSLQPVPPLRLAASLAPAPPAPKPSGGGRRKPRVRASTRQMRKMRRLAVPRRVPAPAAAQQGGAGAGAAAAAAAVAVADAESPRRGLSPRVLPQSARLRSLASNASGATSEHGASIVGVFGAVSRLSGLDPSLPFDLLLSATRREQLLQQSMIRSEDLRASAAGAGAGAAAPGRGSKAATVAVGESLSTVDPDVQAAQMREISRDVRTVVQHARDRARARRTSLREHYAARGLPLGSLAESEPELPMAGLGAPSSSSSDDNDEDEQTGTGSDEEADEQRHMRTSGRVRLAVQVTSDDDEDDNAAAKRLRTPSQRSAADASPGSSSAASFPAVAAIELQFRERHADEAAGGGAEGTLDVFVRAGLSAPFSGFGGRATIDVMGVPGGSPQILRKSPDQHMRRRTESDASLHDDPHLATPPPQQLALPAAGRKLKGLGGTSGVSDGLGPGIILQGGPAAALVLSPVARDAQRRKAAALEESAVFVSTAVAAAQGGAASSPPARPPPANLPFVASAKAAKDRGIPPNALTPAFAVAQNTGWRQLQRNTPRDPAP